MLDDLEKPVVFTGSQLPIGRPRTDGKENLVSAVEIASAKDAEGHALVPEVTIFFNSKLMRGNRTTKVSAEDFDAFRSPNIPPLAEAGINIRYNSSLIRHPRTYGKALKVRDALDTRVSILKVHPGITPQVVSNILLGAETRAVIIETYGSGNAISKDWFIRLLKVADDMGKVLVNVTQCLYGSVNMDIYATGRRLKEAGVVSGFDSTAESMLAKLFHLMGASADNAWVKSKLEENLKGEISE
jgi:L-asparaginase